MIAPPSPPSHDELEALIKEARARQLRRRLLGAAGVAIAAALGLSVYAVVGGGNPVAQLQPPAQGSFAGAPHCQSAQLSGSVGFQASTQMFVGGAVIKNVTDRACSLPAARPQVRLTSHGKPLASAQLPGPSSAGTARVLAPGGRVLIPMQWANGCAVRHLPTGHGGGALVLHKVEFALRLETGVVVRATTTGTPPCLDPGHPFSLVVYPAQATT